VIIGYYLRDILFYIFGMNMAFLINIFEKFSENFFSKIETLGPKVFAAIIVIIIGSVIAYGTYKLTMFVFQKF